MTRPHVAFAPDRSLAILPACINRSHIAIVVATAIAAAMTLWLARCRRCPDLCAHYRGDEYDRFALWSADCYPEDVWLSMYERTVA